MDEKEFTSINFIPFIDIMLVLLTIVLVTSTFIATGAIHVSLPKAATEKTNAMKTLTVTIDRHGTIYMNDRPRSMGQLAAAMKNVDRTTPILIRADKDIALQIFVDVMAKIKNLGFHKVSLQTQSG